MTHDLVLGIDIGTASAKGMLARPDGTIVAVSEPIRSRSPGRAGPSTTPRKSGGPPRSRPACRCRDWSGKALLKAQLLPAVELRKLLDAAGCPSDPAGIGLTLTQVRASYEAVRQIRRRYTVLDLAAETRLLDSCVEELFESDGFWSEP